MCDFAETYHIYDYRQLPLQQAAIFAVGLPADSRIKRKLSGLECSLNDFLLACLVDEVRHLEWMFSKKANKNNMPKPISDSFIAKKEIKKDEQIKVFDSVEAFNKAYRKVVKQNG